MEDPRCSKCGAYLNLNADEDHCIKCGCPINWTEVMAGVLPCRFCKEPVVPGNLYCISCGREDPLHERRRFRLMRMVESVITSKTLLVLILLVLVWTAWK